eukprot:s119_g74.t1
MYECFTPEEDGYYDDALGVVDCNVVEPKEWFEWHWSPDSGTVQQHPSCADDSHLVVYEKRPRDLRPRPPPFPRPPPPVAVSSNPLPPPPPPAVHPSHRSSSDHWTPADRRYRSWDQKWNNDWNQQWDPDDKSWVDNSWNWDVKQESDDEDEKTEPSAAAECFAKIC